MNAKTHAFLTDYGLLNDDPHQPVTTRGPVRSGLLTRSIEVIQDSGLVGVVDEWDRADHPNGHVKGGRPRTLSHRQILIAMLVLGSEPTEMSVKQIHVLLAARLTDQQRTLLGISARRLTYKATWRAQRRLVNLIDPLPGKRRERPTWEAFAEFKAAVTPQRQLELQHRANTFMNTLIAASTQMAQPYIPGRIDLTVDATVYPIYGKDGTPNEPQRKKQQQAHDAERRKKPPSMSPEYLAGWHAKTEENRATASQHGRSGSDEWTFGYDAHLSMIARGKDDTSVPHIITGAVLNTPGMAPGPCAVELGHHAIPLAERLKTKLGYFIVDRGYSDQLQQDFHRPLQARGLTPVIDYKADNLKPTGSYKGMPFVAGSFYHPDTPAGLLTCHYDHLGRKKDHARYIDSETYEARRAELSQYRMLLKQLPKADDSSLVFRYPAKTPLVETSQMRPNENSISVPVAELPKGYQHLEFNSDQWRAVYKPGRSQIEGENRVLKDVEISLADQRQRRGRGFGLHCIIAAIKIAVANFREIGRFLRGGFDQTAPTPPPRRTGRPPKTTFADYAMPTDQPTYVVGERAKERRRRVA